MANTVYSVVNGVRRWTIDTNATALDLGGANPGAVGSFTIHCKGNTVSGDGISVKTSQVGMESAIGWLAKDYEADNTATDGATKITADGVYYVRCDHQEKVQLSFEIAGGSWDIAVSQGPG